MKGQNGPRLTAGLHAFAGLQEGTPQVDEHRAVVAQAVGILRHDGEHIAQIEVLLDEPWNRRDRPGRLGDPVGTLRAHFLKTGRRLTFTPISDDEGMDIEARLYGGRGFFFRSRG